MILMDHFKDNLGTTLRFYIDNKEPKSPKVHIVKGWQSKCPCPTRAKN